MTTMHAPLRGTQIDPKPATALVINMPTHYRAPVFDLLPLSRYHVVYCAHVEPNRQWEPPLLAHNATFLAERFSDRRDGVSYVHNNPGIWKVLSALGPRIILVGGLNPTHLYAIAWALTHGAKIVYMTDGTRLSESTLGPLHRLLRRFVFRLSSAFLVASKGGQELLADYGVDARDVYISRLCARPPSSPPPTLEQRPYDVMFCGRLHPNKMPDFFLEVCAKVRARRGTCKILVIGDGTAATAMRKTARDLGLEVSWAGFVDPSDLELHYRSAKLLLFPTVGDTWGLVASEAMASGTPVITMHTAGCAGDLVLDNANGRVIRCDAEAWAEATCALLDCASLWADYSRAAASRSSEFGFRQAAEAIEMACESTLLRR